MRQQKLGSSSLKSQEWIRETNIHLQLVSLQEEKLWQGFTFSFTVSYADRHAGIHEWGFFLKLGQENIEAHSPHPLHTQNPIKTLAICFLTLPFKIFANLLTPFGVWDLSQTFLFCPSSSQLNAFQGLLSALLFYFTLLWFPVHKHC